MAGSQPDVFQVLIAAAEARRSEAALLVSAAVFQQAGRIPNQVVTNPALGSGLPQAQLVNLGSAAVQPAIRVPLAGVADAGSTLYIYIYIYARGCRIAGCIGRGI